MPLISEPLEELLSTDFKTALRTLDRLAYEQDQLEFTQTFFEAREGNAKGRGSDRQTSRAGMNVPDFHLHYY